MKWDNFEDARNGFTIVEVMLVLAITGLIFAGAVRGINTSLSRQRFNDSVQETAQKFREQYNSATRIQISERERNSSGYCEYVDISRSQASALNRRNLTQRGRTDCNMYGVAIILGLDDGTKFQSNMLLGADLSAYRKKIKEDNITVRNAADIDAELMQMTDSQLLGTLMVNNTFNAKVNARNASQTQCQVTDMVENSDLAWGARLENTDGTAARIAIVIVRSPRDGAVHTYHKWLYNGENIPDYGAGEGCNSSINIADMFSGEQFSTGDIYLCLNSEDARATTGRRRTIKIAADGHSSTAVELIDLDTDESNDRCNNALESAA